MMISFRLFAILVVVFSALTISAQTKIIMQGSYSVVDSPFVFVARNAQTYSQLQELVSDLPSASTIDFNKNCVIAAFTGEKSSGGWTVGINQSKTGIAVSFVAPGKDMMSASVISSPFKISVVPIVEDQNLSLSLPTELLAKMQNFKVSIGEFESADGVVGGTQKFQADGTLRLLTFGNYATMLLDLTETGTDHTRQLVDIASGVFKDGILEFTRIDAGTFAGVSEPPFSVKGILKNGTLSLDFVMISMLNLNDGFARKGRLVAVKF